MLGFTLDTNCIIDLEEDRPNAFFLRKIVQAWRDHKIKLAVVAVTASENQPSGLASETYADFEEKITNIGLVGITHLLPLMYWDVGFWDRALMGDEEMANFAVAIQHVLFPGTDFSPPPEAEKNSRWRNKQCDVLTAWSHAYHKWDYLVTSDENFHKRKEALLSIGVTGIVRPCDALKLCGIWRQ